jgi:hypothetical protein
VQETRLLGELERGHALFIAGDLVRARAVARRVFGRATASGDVASRGRARALVGHVAYDELRYAEARDAFGLAASELSKTLGQDSDEVRLAHASLGLVHNALDQEADARAALVLAEADLDPPGPGLGVERARLWITIAVLRTGLERERDAETVLRSVISRLESGVPWSKLEVLATAHLHLGGAIDACHAGPNYTVAPEAVQAYERCLAIRQSAFGLENPRVAAAAFALAGALTARGDLDRAFELATGAMRTMVELGLERQARMSISQATLGMIELLRGDVSGGTERLELACKIEESTFGAAHAATASMLAMLAQVHAARRNWGKVKSLCARILPVLRAAPRHGDSFAIASELAARAELALGSVGAGVHVLESGLRVLERRDSQNSRRIGELYATLARMELVSGRRERAVRAFERARALALDAHGASSEELRRLDSELELAHSGGRIVVHGCG